MILTIGLFEFKQVLVYLFYNESLYLYIIILIMNLDMLNY